jgi:DNA-binding transcriptional MerR regulator
MHAKREIREQARRLRQQGVSVRDIAKTLQVARSSVSTWVRDIELTDEQLEKLKENQRQYGGRNKGGRANRIKFREQRFAYQEQGRARAREGSPLHMAGCLLYWAEGAKGKNTLYFVNSDPNMHLLFMRFLREEMGVQADECSIYIQTHYQEPEQIKNIEAYWTELLQLPLSCVRKTHIKKGSETRQNKLKHGVCGVMVCKTSLIQHIYGAIQEYGGFDNPDWLF